jgi:hypothetical protein
MKLSRLNFVFLLLVFGIVLRSTFLSAVSDNGEREIILSATTTDFYLGAAYDCRTDQLIPALSPWNPSAISTVSTRNISSFSFEVLLDESAGSKLKKLGISAQLQISVMAGMVEVTGSSTYLKQTSSNYHSLSFSLIYRSIAKFDHLDMDQISKTQYQGVLDGNDLATHIVSGIEYGADYVVTFSTFIQNGESVDDVTAQLQASFNKIPGISVSGDASLSIKGSSSTHTRNIAVTCYGELTLPAQNACPTDFSNVENFLKEVSACKPGDCGMVPKKVYLYPLSMLSSKTATIVKELDEDLIEYAVTILGELSDKLSYLKGVYSWNQVSEVMSPVQDQAQQVYETLDVVKTKVNSQVSESVVSIRSGLSTSDISLSDMLANLKQYLSVANLDTWSSTLGTFLSKLGSELSSIENDIGGLKTEYAMGVDGKESWLVLWINLDNSYADQFSTASDDFSANIQRSSFISQTIDPWSWSDSAETGRTVKLFKQLYNINTELSASSNGFNIISSSASNPDRVAQLALFSNGQFKFINPKAPVIIGFNNSQYVENMTWLTIEDAYGYIVKLAKSTDNGTTVSFTTQDTFLDLPDRYSRCSDCSVQICALYSKTMCGPWSDWMEIPRFSSPYLNSIAAQTQCTLLQSPNHIFNASLLANASLEVSCNASGGTSALTNWHLTHEVCQDPWFQFQYSCGRLNPNVLGSSGCSSNYTTCRDYQSDRIIDLSLHNVACPADSVMTEWRMNVAECPSSQMRIDYQCCPLKQPLCTTEETPCSQIGAVNFLDRQIVGCPKGTLMQGFQLQLCDSSNMNFRLSCCGVTTN